MHDVRRESPGPAQTAAPTPRAAGYHMPAELEPHDAA